MSCFLATGLEIQFVGQHNSALAFYWKIWGFVGIYWDEVFVSRNNRLLRTAAPWISVHGCDGNGVDLNPGKVSLPRQKYISQTCFVFSQIAMSTDVVFTCGMNGVFLKMRHSRTRVDLTPVRLVFGTVTVCCGMFVSNRLSRWRSPVYLKWICERMRDAYKVGNFCS